MISDRKILRASRPFIPVNRSRRLHGVDLTDFRRAFVNADKSRSRRSFYENVKRFYATQSQLPHIRPKYTCALHISNNIFIHLLSRITKRLYATRSQLPHIQPKYTCAFHISIGRFIHLLPRIAKRLYATQSQLPHIRPKHKRPSHISNDHTKTYKILNYSKYKI